MRTDFLSLPPNLPVPQDDGACDRLAGAWMPAVSLPTTSGRLARLVVETRTPTLIFFYPRSGRPDEPAPVGWDEIPGARGCTPQSCGFRDVLAEFKALGVKVFGASAQSTEYQEEFAERMRLPFELLSDEKGELTDALHLPTFEYGGRRLIRRLALFCEHGRVRKAFYPVFPPDQSASTALAWLRLRWSPLRAPLRAPAARVEIEIGNGCRFSDVGPDDAEAYVRWLADRSIYETTLNIPYPYSIDDADGWINRTLAESAELGRSVNWALRDSGGHLIGGIGFAGCVPGRSWKAEIGYWLAKPYWGQGIMTRAVRAASAYAFRELGLERITANVFARNAASARVLEKCGFTLEGRMRSHYRKDGRAMDGLHYARLKDDPA